MLGLVHGIRAVRILLDLATGAEAPPRNSLDPGMRLWAWLKNGAGALGSTYAALKTLLIAPLTGLTSALP